MGLFRPCPEHFPHPHPQEKCDGFRCGEPTLQNKTDCYSKYDNQNFETSCLYCAVFIIVLSCLFLTANF